MPPQKPPGAIGSKPYRVMFMPSVWYEKGSGIWRLVGDIIESGNWPNVVVFSGDVKP